MTEEHILKLSGGGDWHVAYILLYAPQRLEKMKEEEEEEVGGCVFANFPSFEIEMCVILLVSECLLHARVFKNKDAEISSTLCVMTSSLPQTPPTVETTAATETGAPMDSDPPQTD